MPAPKGCQEFDGEVISSNYARFRPTYTPALYQSIMDYCREGNIQFQPSLALDLACGTGQGTTNLAPFFDKVIGVDLTESQILEARNNHNMPQNISFRLGPAEDLSFLSNNSVDVVTVASAIHWVNRDLLYPELQRVLKPGGVLAVYSYCEHEFDKEQASLLLRKLSRETIGSYWTEDSKYDWNKYADLPVPFPNRKREEFSIAQETDLAQILGFVASWSGFRAYKYANPDSDLLKDLEQQLLEIYGKKDGVKGARDLKLSTKLTVYLVMSKKPM